MIKQDARLTVESFVFDEFGVSHLPTDKEKVTSVKRKNFCEKSPTIVTNVEFLKCSKVMKLGFIIFRNVSTMFVYVLSFTSNSDGSFV